MIKDKTLDKHQQKLVDAKRKEFEQQQNTAATDDCESGFPDGAQLCSKCQTKATVLMDGCMTCLNCGDSKCG